MGYCSRRWGFLLDRGISMQANDVENEANLNAISKQYQEFINQMYVHLLSARDKSNEVKSRYIAQVIQIGVAVVDFTQAHKIYKYGGGDGFSAKVLIRPLILRAYEQDLAMSHWAKELNDISSLVQAPDESSHYRAERAKHRVALKKLQKMSNIRNTIGHSGGEAASFIADICSVNIDEVEPCCLAMLDCTIKLLTHALQLAPYINAWKSDRQHGCP